MFLFEQSMLQCTRQKWSKINGLDAVSERGPLKSTSLTFYTACVCFSIRKEHSKSHPPYGGRCVCASSSLSICVPKRKHLSHSMMNTKSVSFSMGYIFTWRIFPWRWTKMCIAFTLTFWRKKNTFHMWIDRHRESLCSIYSIHSPKPITKTLSFAHWSASAAEWKRPPPPPLHKRCHLFANNNNVCVCETVCNSMYNDIPVLCVLEIVFWVDHILSRSLYPHLL